MGARVSEQWWGAKRRIIILALLRKDDRCLSSTSFIHGRILIWAGFLPNFLSLFHLHLLPSSELFFVECLFDGSLTIQHLARWRINSFPLLCHERIELFGSNHAFGFAMGSFGLILGDNNGSLGFFGTDWSTGTRSSSRLKTSKRRSILLVQRQRTKKYAETLDLVKDIVGATKEKLVGAKEEWKIRTTLGNDLVTAVTKKEKPM